MYFMSSEQPTDTFSSGQRRLALVIGVNEAANSSLPALKHSIDDATKMAEVLRDSCGFELFQPPLLGEHATSERVKSAVLALARERGENDFLLLYFSGHGQPMTVGGDQPDIYLATHNFSEREVEEDETLHFSMRWLQNKLYIPTQAGRVLLILDCCYAGNIGMTATNPYLDDLKAHIYKFFGQPMGSDEAHKGGLRLALTATGHDQTAGELDGYGLMTKYLVEALQGHVDDVLELENQGKVSLQRVQRYLETVMPVTQNPSVEGGYAGKDCVLAQYPERAEVLRRKHTLVVNERPHTYIPFAPKASFQPRPHEIETIGRMLFPVETGDTTPPRVGLVGVIGMGGIGKTQLAVELAHRYKERFTAGMFWMSATGTTLIEWQHQFAVLATNTEYLTADDDVSHPENEARRARHLCHYLASHLEALLILDNVENTDLVLTALTAIAGVEARCTLLYTSRNTITPLGVKRHVVERLPEDGALNLLLTHKPALLPLALQKDTLDAEAQDARTICRYVDYLPLALTLLRDLLQDEYLTLAHLAEQLKVRGAFDITKDYDETETRLFTTFQLSWNKITDSGAQRLFQLAAYFPEATAIPLWLLGLAAGLGETGNTRLEPLGRARLQLQKWSMIEGLENEQIRLHPLIREFGRHLVTHDEQGNKTLQEAGQRLIAEFTDINKLEQRAFAVGYWRCLEQVQQAYQYAQILDANNIETLERIEQWLARDSSLLGTDDFWPEKMPGLFYQLLHNHFVEAGYHVPATRKQSVPWVRQCKQVGIEDGTLLREFKHHDSVICVAYSPDSRTIATGCEDGVAHLWDVASGRTLVKFRGHTSGIFCLAFSPDGTRIATGSDDTTARIWNPTNGKELQLLKGHSEKIYSIAFSTDSTKIVTTAEDGDGRVWEVVTGREVAFLSERHVSLNHAIFTPDGEMIISCSEHGAHLWDIKSEKLLKEIREYTVGWAVKVAILHGTESVVISSKRDSGSTDGSKVITKVWNTKNKRILTEIYENSSDTNTSLGIKDVVLSSDGEKIVLCSGEKLVRIWDTRDSTVITTLSGHTGNVTSTDFSPDGKAVVTGSEDRIARIYRISSTKDKPEAIISKGHARDISFSHDGAKLAVGTAHGTICLWNTQTGNLINTIQGTVSWINCVAFSPDDKKIVFGSPNHLKILDAASGYVHMELDDLLASEHNPSKALLPVEVNIVCFSPNGKVIADGNDWHGVQLWDVTSGELIKEMTGHQSDVDLMAFSPDETRIVTGSQDGTARIWNALDYTTIAILKNHVGGVTCLCISLDNTLIATASLDGKVHIWSMQNGKELSVLKRRRIAPSSMAFSPDSSLLLVNDRYAYTSLWKMDGQGNGQLVGTYTTANEVQAIHWQDTRHVILAGVDGSGYEPQFYHLALEGDW